MPLRMLSYAAREYERRGLTKKVYSRRRIEIPTLELYMLYNGAEDQPIMQELKLSDAYIAKCGKISLEARVKVINVNYDKGADILKRCKTLNEYKHVHPYDKGKAAGEGTAESCGGECEGMYEKRDTDGVSREERW